MARRQATAGSRMGAPRVGIFGAAVVVRASPRCVDAAALRLCGGVLDTARHRATAAYVFIAGAPRRPRDWPASRACAARPDAHPVRGSSWLRCVAAWVAADHAAASGVAITRSFAAAREA